MTKRRTHFALATFLLTFSINFSALALSNCEAIQSPAGNLVTTVIPVKNSTTTVPGFNGGNTPARLRYFTLKCLEELSGDKSFSEGLASSAPATTACSGKNCYIYQ